MITEKNHPILIIGGGIGGLATAIGLRKAGFNVAVFEKASELQADGAGLSLWSNAIRALDKLGMGTPARMSHTESIDKNGASWFPDEAIRICSGI